MYTAKKVLAAFNETINGSEEIYRAVAKSFGLSDCAFWILYCIHLVAQARILSLPDPF